MIIVYRNMGHIKYNLIEKMDHMVKHFIIVKIASMNSKFYYYKLSTKFSRIASITTNPLSGLIDASNAVFNSSFSSFTSL